MDNLSKILLACITMLSTNIYADLLGSKSESTMNNDSKNSTSSIDIKSAIKCELNKQETSRINIKGFYIGMNKCEFDAKYELDFSFTIAEVKVVDPMIEFIDDKLASFASEFPSDDFETIFGAFKQKYPDLKCTSSEVNNRLGAKFSQINCILEDEKGALLLNRFTKTIDKGIIALISKKSIQKIKQEEKNKLQDI